jgi:serine/threonine-protein kinase
MRETLQQPGTPMRVCHNCGATLPAHALVCSACGAALDGATGRLVTGHLLAGRYRIVGLIARGGMGAVYRAEDTRLDGAVVAVKEMASGFVRGDTEAFAQALADFQREATMLAKLRHAALPRVSDQFAEGGKHYLVMEFIAGHTLRDALQRADGRLPLPQALNYANQLCDVLAYLHAQQPPIIYRDLKPSNIMIIAAGEADQIVLVDFGIARFYRPGRTTDTAIYVTNGYAPPEQYGQGQTDARTDVYALGVVLHQMLTGHDPAKPPFALPPLHTFDPTLPHSIAATVQQATATDRAARFASVAELRAALHATHASWDTPTEAVRAPHLPSAVDAKRPRKPRWALWIGAVVALILILGVSLLLFVLPVSRQSTGTTAGTTVTSPTTDDIVVSDQPPPGPTLLLRPSRVSASGYAEAAIDAQGNSVTYEPANAIDGRPDTTWRVAGDGTNQWLQLDFTTEVSVRAIGLIPGYAKIDAFDQTDRFLQNRVVKAARFEFSDGSSLRAEFARQPELQFVPVGDVRTHFIRIIIEETYPAPPKEQGGRDFTPIAEVQVQGGM